jgi:hypothetical protein
VRGWASRLGPAPDRPIGTGRKIYEKTGNTPGDGRNRGTQRLPKLPRGSRRPARHRYGSRLGSGRYQYAKRGSGCKSLAGHPGAVARLAATSTLRAVRAPHRGRGAATHPEGTGLCRGPPEPLRQAKAEESTSALRRRNRLTTSCRGLRPWRLWRRGTSPRAWPGP